MTLIRPHFNREELACKHCGEMRLGDEFLDALEALRVKLDHPMPINSGYRCLAHNWAVYNPRAVGRGENGGKEGPHTIVAEGQGAVDVRIFGKPAHLLLVIAIGFGFDGVGVFQKGPHDRRYLHLDRTRERPGAPRPALWSY